jgi:putative oxidoreductase
VENDMRLLAPSDPRQLDTGMAIVRIITGIIFIAHGAQKVFGFGIGGTTQFFTQVGAPLPGVAAPLVAALELVGGVALVIGLLTRLVALGLALDMLGAILLVHLANGFFVGGNGVEFVLLLMVNAIALVVAGPGAFSLDGAIGRRRFVGHPAGRR